MQKHVVDQSTSFVPVEIIQNKIYLIRGHKVMLDKDLAELYGVTTGNLNKTVKRNAERFPQDFMFQLTQEEADSLIFQFGRPKEGRGGSRYLSYTFTEQGVAMLSSVLKSKSAVQVNIQIMRVFTKLREMMISHKDLARKIEDLERKFEAKFKEHDRRIILVFNAINDLLTDQEEAVKERGPMGFVVHKPDEKVSKSRRK